MKNLIENIDGTEALVKECIEFITNNKQIVIFGAGVGGNILADLVNKQELSSNVCCFSDNNNLKYHTKFNGKLILPPENLIEKYPEAKIVVASSAYPEIHEQLLSFGYKANDIRLYNFAFSELDYTDKEFIHDHLADFERAYTYMADNKSRNIFIKILNYKITKNNKWLDELYNFVDDEKNQYFDKELLNFDHIDNFVDVGSYIGDTFEHSQNSGIDYQNYYCFEADPNVFEVLRNNIANERNVTLFNIGLWNKEDTLVFSNLNPGSSTISDKDESSELDCNFIKVNKLDNILKSEKIDFIKLDIEGAEFEAIQGMEQIIKNQLPALTFAVYHKRDDYFKLLDLINTFVPNEYKFYFRQYRYTPTETICYAVPQKYTK